MIKLNLLLLAAVEEVSNASTTTLRKQVKIDEIIGHHEGSMFEIWVKNSCTLDIDRQMRPIFCLADVKYGTWEF